MTRKRLSLVGIRSLRNGVVYPQAHGLARWICGALILTLPITSVVCQSNPSQSDHINQLKAQTPVASEGGVGGAQCSTHIRNWSHPLSSNICDADYKEWKRERIESGVWKQPAWHNKQWWAGTGIIGGSIALDAWSTSRVSSLPGHEASWLLPTHPSNGQIAAWGAGSFALNVGLHFLSYKWSHNDPAKGWRAAGKWGIPVVSAVTHGIAAGHNLSLR